MHGPHSVSDTGHCTVIHCDTVCRWLTNEWQRKTDIRLTDQYYKMFPQTDKSWRDYRAPIKIGLINLYWRAVQYVSPLHNDVFCILSELLQYAMSYWT